MLQVDLEESTDKPSYPAMDTLVGSPLSVLPQDQEDKELEEHEEQDEKQDHEEHAWEKGTAGDEEDVTEHNEEVLISVIEAVISELTSEAQEMPNILEMESGNSVLGGVATESPGIEMVGEETTKWGNLISNEPTDSSESQEPEDETDTLAPLLPSREEIIGWQIGIPAMEAGEDNARIDTGIAMTETPSITESATTALGLTDIVTGKILEVPTVTTFNILPPTITANKTSRLTSTVAIPTTATKVTTTIHITTTAAIATKAKNTVTKIWIQTSQTKTTPRTSSNLSSLPSVTSNHSYISDVNTGVTKIYVEKTKAGEAKSIENQDLSSWTEEPEIASSLQPDALIFPAVFLTTQAESVTEVPEVLTLQPDHLPDSTTGKENAFINQFDTAVFPQEVVTLKPYFDMKTIVVANQTEKPVEGSKRTKEAQPRSIQATEGQNSLQLQPGKRPEAKIDALWAVILGSSRPSCASGLVCGGVCLERQQVCDSLQDCEDGRDEAQCGQLPDCRVGEFHCLKGRCIPEAWKCDGKPDCHHGEDEVSETGAVISTKTEMTTKCQC